MTDPKLLEQYLALYPSPEQLNPLSDAVTEQGNIKTQTLSQHAKENIPQALRSILDVEIDALAKLETQQEEVQKRQSLFEQTLAAGKQIFLVGCGASGRLALSVERFLTIYCETLPIKAVVAGGDIAIVHEVAAFEDHPQRLIKQLQQQGFQPGDAVIGLSASGRAPAILNCCDYAAQYSPTRVALITCNSKDKVLAYRQEQQQQGLLSPQLLTEIEIIALPTVPPALAGSTRMSPTTVMMLSCLPLLNLLIPQHAIDLSKAISELIGLLKKTDATLLAKLVTYEAGFYQQERRILYHAPADGMTALTIFTDLTERNPTFNLPKLQPNTPQSENPAFCWLHIANQENTKACWQILLKRPAYDLALDAYPQTTPTYRLAFDFSQPIMSNWPNHGNIYLQNTSEGFVWRFGKQQLSLSANCHPFIKQLFLKILLNAHSTTVMARLGYCESNLMTHLSPNNIKLLLRSEQILKALLGNRYSPSQLRQAFCAAFRELKPKQSLIKETLQYLRRISH